jgi:hypothetical protein
MNILLLPMLVIIIILFVWLIFTCHVIKRTADSLCAYQRVLGELQAAIDMLDVNNIVCIGDFNADPNRGRVWPYLYDFIEHNHFNVPDLLLPIDTFTYLSPAHNTTSWLDHVVSSDAVNVCNVCVHYDIALFDHFPISFNIAIDKAENLNALDDHEQRDEALLNKFVDWPNFDNIAKNKYNNIAS